MKIKKINDTAYNIYLFSISDEVSLKEVIIRLKVYLNLDGFYKVLYTNKKIGCLIKLVKLEDSFYKNTLDLKMEEVEYEVYFKTTDYFIIMDCSNIKYLDGIYYALVDDSFDKIIEKVEFGDFVFGYDIKDIINKCYVI